MNTDTRQQVAAEIEAALALLEAEHAVEAARRNLATIQAAGSGSASFTPVFGRFSEATRRGHLYHNRGMALKDQLLSLAALAILGLVIAGVWHAREKSVDYYLANPEEAREYNDQCKRDGMPVFTTEAHTNRVKNCMAAHSAVIVLNLKEK